MHSQWKEADIYHVHHVSYVCLHARITDQHHQLWIIWLSIYLLVE